MLKVLGWLYRAAQKGLAPLFWAKSKQGVVLKVAGWLLGVLAWHYSQRFPGWLLGALVGDYSKRLQSWLDIDWTHWAVAILGCLLLSCYVALCIVEKETDSARRVSLLSETIEPKFLPEAQLGEVDFVSGRPKLKLENVLQLLYVATIRNENSAPVRVAFPSLELFAKARGSLWKCIPTSVVRASTWGHINNKYWHHSQGAEVPAGDQVPIVFKVYLTAENGSAAFLNRSLRLKGFLDVIGKPKVPLDIRLPLIKSND
jgi:hypothetical protein